MYLLYYHSPFHCSYHDYDTIYLSLQANKLLLQCKQTFKQVKGKIWV